MKYHFVNFFLEMQDYFGKHYLDIIDGEYEFFPENRFNNANGATFLSGLCIKFAFASATLAILSS